MPLLLYISSSFQRCLKTLGPEQIKIVGRILEALEIYYSTVCQLSKAQTIETRFFYKQLRKPFYEAGVEGKIRVVIERDKSKCTALLAGNHDQIKRFLANQ